MANFLNLTYLVIIRSVMIERKKWKGKYLLEKQTCSGANINGCNKVKRKLRL